MPMIGTDKLSCLSGCPSGQNWPFRRHLSPSPPAWWVPPFTCGKRMLPAYAGRSDFHAQAGTRHPTGWPGCSRQAPTCRICPVAKRFQWNPALLTFMTILPGTIATESVGRLGSGGECRMALVIGATCLKKWSGRRGSNPRPKVWETFALPLSYARL